MALRARGERGGGDEPSTRSSPPSRRRNAPMRARAYCGAAEYADACSGVCIVVPVLWTHPAFNMPVGGLRRGSGTERALVKRNKRNGPLSNGTKASPLGQAEGRSDHPRPAAGRKGARESARECARAAAASQQPCRQQPPSEKRRSAISCLPAAAQSREERRF